MAWWFELDKKLVCVYCVGQVHVPFIQQGEDSMLIRLGFWTLVWVLVSAALFTGLDAFAGKVFLYWTTRSPLVVAMFVIGLIGGIIWTATSKPKAS